MLVLSVQKSLVKDDDASTRQLRLYACAMLMRGPEFLRTISNFQAYWWEAGGKGMLMEGGGMPGASVI